MLLKVDVRENKLIKLLQNTNSEYGFTIKIENLHLGDIIICDDNGKELILIERKSLADLASSIRDGRYAEQSYRLAEYPVHNHNIVYLIEGNLSNFGMNPYSNFSKKNPINKKTLRSTMLSVMYYKGFSVMQTVSLVETAEVIMQMTDKIKRETNKKSAYYFNGGADKGADREAEYGENGLEKGVGQGVGEEDNGKITDLNLVIEPKAVEKRYSEVVKKVKKDNITIDNIGEIMLSQIPAVSTAGAIAIMKEYKSVDNLISKLRENPKCLDDIKTKTTGGGERRISKTCIANIIRFLLQMEEDVIVVDV